MKNPWKYGVKPVKGFPKKPSRFPMEKRGMELSMTDFPGASPADARAGFCAGPYGGVREPSGAP